MEIVLEEMITKGINQSKISEKIFGKAFPNKEVSYNYNGKRDFMSARWMNITEEVIIRVNDEIYVKLDRKKIRKGKVLEIYEYISKDNINPSKIYLAKIDLGIVKFTLHLHPKTIIYGFNE